MAEAKPKLVQVVSVVRNPGSINVPPDVALPVAIDALQKALKAEETIVEVIEAIDGVPQDAAHALARVLEAQFGYVANIPRTNAFGEKIPPQTVGIEVGPDPDDIVQVPAYGTQFQVPGVDGLISTDIVEKDGKGTFVIRAEVKARFEAAIKELASLTRAYLAEHSIYKGRSLVVRTRDERGRLMPIPQIKFFKHNPNIENEVLFNEDIEAAVRINILAKIRYTDACATVGTSKKRGILLAGDYGTGKTMLAHKIAIVANRCDWTYIVAERADELADVIRFANYFRPAVLFNEDIDQVMSGERSIDTDAILNIIDGIESKSAEIMVVLTTNHPENINAAMLRPGRLDALIKVAAPNEKTVRGLLRLYGRGYVTDDMDLTRVAQMLAGQKAAIAMECVERALANAIDRVGGVVADISLSEQDLYESALTLQNESALRDPKKDQTEPSNITAAKIIARAMTGETVVVTDIEEHGYSYPVEVGLFDEVK
jgi:SpoVK/Ycf46/Vps4 family AAA+-type ATPase